MARRKCFDRGATIGVIVAADMVQFDAMAAAVPGIVVDRKVRLGTKAMLIFGVGKVAANR